MGRPRFLADHDLNEHIVTGVVRQEPVIEFLRVRDLGLSARPDDEILAYAATKGLVVVSHDVNTMPAAAFARLAVGEPLAGLFMVPQRAPIAAVIGALVMIWAAGELEEWKNQVVFLPFS
jgi:hypothetical protein